MYLGETECMQYTASAVEAEVEKWVVEEKHKKEEEKSGAQM